MLLQKFFLLLIRFDNTDNYVKIIPISNKREWNNRFIKRPTEYREFFPTLFVKTDYFQVVFNFKQTRTAVTKFGEHGIMAHIPTGSPSSK